jgi:hypothetical protein
MAFHGITTTATRQKISEANRGKVPWNKGKHWPKHVRRRISTGMRGHSVTLETRRKISNTKLAGRIPSQELRNGLEYKIWRKAVLERDGYKCIWCGDTHHLHADHIKPWAFYPEVRFAIDNGRTLCFECHKKTDTYLKNRQPIH